MMGEGIPILGTTLELIPIRPDTRIDPASVPGTRKGQEMKRLVIALVLVMGAGRSSLGGYRTGGWPYRDGGAHQEGGCSGEAGG